jgi:hypothetical protein
MGAKEYKQVDNLTAVNALAEAGWRLHSFVSRILSDQESLVYMLERDKPQPKRPPRELPTSTRIPTYWSNCPNPLYGKPLLCDNCNYKSFEHEERGGGMETDLDCGDNSCYFATAKGGMRTNGGCRCLSHYGFSSSLLKAVRELLPEVLRLRRQLGIQEGGTPR